jgi:DMSO reductase anchor subunit
MVIPGVQALFGFQLIAIFNQGFDEKLSEPVQLVHLAALILTALSMALVMTPAAIHRIAEPVSVSERFLWMASNLLLAGMVVLMVALGLDIYVVATIVTDSRAVAVVLGIVLVIVFASMWLLLPKRESSLRE